MIRRLLPIVAIVLGAVIVPLRAHVRITTTDGDTPGWFVPIVAYSISADGLPDILNGSEFLAVQEGFETWAEVEGSSLSFNYLGTTPSSDVGLDSTNLVTFTDNSVPFGSSTVAVTLTFFHGTPGQRTFREADIAFNPLFDFTTSGEAGQFDLQGVMTHEIGHLVGLDHTGIVSSVMAPFAVRNQTDQRVLQYDDIAGIRSIYPSQGTPSEPTGTISGKVESNGIPASGAHVVAMAVDGTPLVSTIATSGDYTLEVPAGDYYVYAEPLDGPVKGTNVSRYFGPFNTTFAPTFHGDTASLAEATVVGVESDSELEGIDISAIQKGVSGLNFTSPAFAPRVARGSTGTLTVGGDGVAEGLTLEWSTPLVTSNAPTFFGSFAAIQTTIDAATPLGPKTIIGVLGDTVSLVSGALVVTDASPVPFTVLPSDGPFEGGTIVQVQGQNFRTGVQVHFGGLPATDVQLITDSLIQVTTPENAPAPTNVQVFNSDGTSGLLLDGFRYTAPPPSVSSLLPLTGPVATPIVIEGENFDVRPQNVIVRFNGQLARVIDSARTRIETVVPFGASTGPVTVSVFGEETTAGTFEVTPDVPSANIAPLSPETIDATPAGGGSLLIFLDDDDGVFFMDLPFTFSLFTDTFVAGERISISTNGWISLDGASNPEWQNASLPASFVERTTGSIGSIAAAMVAPFFDDLTFEPGGSLSTLTTGLPPNRKLVVQWDGASILDEVGTDLTADLTFQLILYEGSNDIRFIYDQMSGDRSDGSSATVGMQNLARDTAFQSGFEKPIIESGKIITYSFDNGTYTETLPPETGEPPAIPTVTDGGAVTASQSDLIASWVLAETGSEAVEFEYAIGTTPGATDTRDFTSVVANSVVATGLSLVDGSTYYLAVRGRNSDGQAGEAGVSDGIRVDTAFVPTVLVFPSVTQGESVFGGLAFMADVPTDIVLRAVNTDGSLTTGLGIRNPTRVSVDGNQQLAQLVVELFGLAEFDGWIELESSESSLRAATSTGASDLSFIDGAAASPQLSDFFLLHDGAVAFMVNTDSSDATATITELGTGETQALAIPARGRATITLSGGPVRVTSPSPIAALERLGTSTSLAFGPPVTGPERSLVFPHAVVGGGYRSWVTVANTSVAMQPVRVTFGGESRGAFVPPNATLRFSVAELTGLGGEALVSDAVRVVSRNPFAGPSLLGVIDIELDTTLVTLAAGGSATDVTFPHVADLGGTFTGIALATGPTGATVSIEVFTASGEPSGSGMVTVPPNSQVARLVREFIPEFPGQNGGYIRLQSDQPIWAWEIYGTLDAMASGPPL